MQAIRIDRDWTFRRGLMDSLGAMKADPGVVVNLPHDGMIGTAVSPNAPAKSDMGYFTGDLSNYTKFVFLPKEWEGECVGLQIDGAMLNATVEVNGYKAGVQHYGYAPFYVDLSDLVAFGEENRITIHVNASMQPNSRWYTGSGLYRGVKLLHGPKVHLVPDGVFVHTKEVADGCAFLEALIDVQNDTGENRLVEVEVTLSEEISTGNGAALPKEQGKAVACTKRVIQVNSREAETARMAITLKNPKLWDADEPNLYKVKVRTTDLGVYRTHFIKNKVQDPMADGEAEQGNCGCSCVGDEAEVLFGVRTITVDAERGLRINGKTVKLKGGCLHHDNGLLGAVSLYESEARKVKKLKEVGFNAIRTAHNPPSAALIEACDRLGMYVFDEAFDAWGIAKRGGDYSQFFADCWERDLTAFVRRDRVHPCVILWSTGNEIPERGGLNNGYSLATRLAETIHGLDGSRPVSNGICSLWSGLDDYLADGQNQAQNAADESSQVSWEKVTEPFTNGMDVVGYNYMEDLYERDHEMFPERVILGSENFPKEIGFRWPLVEKLPYVIGEFTWTAWDYLGEAGIGKAAYFRQDDPFVERGSWALMPPEGSPYPWRLANDADFDITGQVLAQGAYRSVVWGNQQTFLYSYHPDAFGKVELITLWGFPAVIPSWNFAGYEGKPVELMVFSNAQEVELFVNGRSLGKKAVSKERPMPGSVRFETVYEPGKVEAISYVDGMEVSRAALETTGKPVSLRLLPEKTKLCADGHDLAYVGVEILDEQGRVVPDAKVSLEAVLLCDKAQGIDGASGDHASENVENSGAKLKKCGWLAAFGTANPVTDEDYTDQRTVSYRGRAMAILRAGYGAGKMVLTVSGEGLPAESIEVIAE